MKMIALDRQGTQNIDLNVVCRFYTGVLRLVLFQIQAQKGIVGIWLQRGGRKGDEGWATISIQRAHIYVAHNICHSTSRKSTLLWTVRKRKTIFKLYMRCKEYVELSQATVTVDRTQLQSRVSTLQKPLIHMLKASVTETKKSYALLTIGSQ